MTKAPTLTETEAKRLEPLAAAVARMLGEPLPPHRRRARMLGEPPPWQPLSASVGGGGTSGRASGSPADTGLLSAAEGPFWCPGCSAAHQTTVHTNHGEPCCPRCGGPLEEQGTGDDDPDA